MSLFNIKKTRKIHRYLGLFIGIQFIFWTIGGLYFSWTNIEEIHGDQFLSASSDKPSLSNTNFPFPLNNAVDSTMVVEALELTFIANEAYYLLNDSLLYNARSGNYLPHINEEQARAIVMQQLKNDLSISSVDWLIQDDVGAHHEYRKKPLPAWVFSFAEKKDLRAYVSANTGQFQKIRHNKWRIFDFFWMLHTMDFQGRDNFNNYVLRGFSILGLLTISSGFLLFYLTSPMRPKR